MKNILIKTINFLKEMDFLWSLPLAMATFIFFPIVGAKLWGDGFAMYDPSFIHAMIYAGLVVVTFNSMTQMGIYINFPEVYDFYLGTGFKELPTIQKCVIFLFVYVFTFSSLLITWVLLV